MLLVLKLDVPDLAATRFAISPLAGTSRAMLLLASPNPSTVNLPWVRWGTAELGRRPLQLPRMFGDHPWPDSATELFERPRR
jgi:hypothetical protein